MRELKVKVFRFDPGKDKEPRHEEYKVPYSHKMRAIEVINYIQEHYDGTLAFRANCRAGRCGSDAVEINGKPVLACKTMVKMDDKEGIVIGPLKAFPVVKDLVVDFSKVWETDLPAFQPPQSGKDFWIMKQEEVESVREMRSCIECFICHDSCHVIKDHKADYIGPRFVVKAAALDKHPKDTHKQRYKLLKEKGIWLCNVSRCCQENCPEKIRITDNAIIYAKERNMDDFGIFLPIKKLFRRKINE